MLEKLKALFGFGRRAPAPAAPESRERAPRAEDSEADRKPREEPRPATQAAAPALGADAQAFYAGLRDPEPSEDLQALAPDDRLFVSGVLKLLREQALRIPVLPQAALEISRLLSDPSASASRFAKVLEADPGLSMDVLRIANSAYYGFGSATTSVRTAVVRIGLTQLRGLIIVTHLHGKVLQGGTLAREASWLSELSLGLAHAAQALAPDFGLRPDAAFTQGVLSHVEHFVILGTAAEVSREHKRRIQPTGQGLREAFARCGTRVRELAAREWGLTEVLLGGKEQDPLARSLRDLREALVAHWAGEAVLPAVAGAPPDRVAQALQRSAAARPAAAEA
ncbi:MAG: HDOD domain-containing protein [Thermodesulfobacteriota bacterium]